MSQDDRPATPIHNDILRNSHVEMPSLNEPEKPILFNHQDSIAENRISIEKDGNEEKIKEGLKNKLNLLKDSLDSNTLTSQQAISLLSLFNDNEVEEKEHTFKCIIKMVKDLENKEKVIKRCGIKEEVNPNKSGKLKKLDDSIGNSNEFQGYSHLSQNICQHNMNGTGYQSMNTTVNNCQFNSQYGFYQTQTGECHPYNAPYYNSQEFNNSFNYSPFQP